MRGRAALLGLLVAGCVDLRRPPELEVVSDGSVADVTVYDGPLPDRPPAANGRPCATNPGCVSGQCIDGVCCATSCAGACRSCNVAGMEGTCSAVPSGEDPDNDCGQEAVSLCGLDGTCDGKGACRRHAPGTECAPGGCSGSTERAASTCDGNGTCKPGTSRACSGLCQGSSCGSACASHSECQEGFFCSGTCVLKRVMGLRCAGAAECASGYCVDGFCCSNECKQSCYSCALSGSEGTCTAVASGQDPRNNCPAQAAATCGRLGACNGKGGCRLHVAGTECVPQSCAGSTETAHSTCDGLGACLAGGTRDCSPFICAATACRTTCTSTSECKPGKICMGGQCVSSGLVLRWRFDEPSGAVALDSSGNGFGGTYLGDSGIPTPSTNLPPTRFTNPSSRAFDLTRRHAVRLAPLPSKLQSRGEFTVSLWFRSTSVDIVGGDAFNLGGDYIVRIKSDQIEWVKHATNISGLMNHVCERLGTGHLDGQWHHLAGVSTTTQMTMYLDGALQCTRDSNVDPLYEGTELWVGRNCCGSTELDFGGGLDDIRVYSRALSPAEIGSLAAGND
jgi:hypothetical protein